MKKRLFGSLLVALLVVGTVVVAWAQVYPVRWPDESESLAPAVSAGVVAIGDGGISLNPDKTTSTDAAGFAPGAYRFSDASCSEANRGEIRLWSITFTTATPDVISDALCWCQKREQSSTTYRWVCINTSVD